MRPGLPACFLALLLVCIAGCAVEEPLSEADKRLFLRPADLVRYGFRYADPESYEKFSKSRQIDGGYQLKYEFQPDQSEPRRVFIYASVSVAKSESDAALNEGAEAVGMVIGLKASGVEEREVRLKSGNDQSKLRLLVKGDKPLGNIFTTRDGRKTYFIVVTGLYFDDPEDWRKLVAPKLEQLAGYSPA
ncbi:MAG TPA: hypothetical protein VH600_13240 [Burkholderiales bacterium]|jgi:hypothetical protein